MSGCAWNYDTEVPHKIASTGTAVTKVSKRKLTTIRTIRVITKKVTLIITLILTLILTLVLIVLVM